MFGLKVVSESILSSCRIMYLSLLPFIWYNLLPSFVTDILELLLAIGTNRVVVIKRVAQCVDEVSVGTSIVITVAVLLEMAARSLFHLMFSCSKIEFMAGMK